MTRLAIKHRLTTPPVPVIVGGSDRAGRLVGAVLTNPDVSGGILVPTGTTDINALVQSSPTGTKLVLAPGATYTMTTSIIPKTGIVLVGQLDALGKPSILSGGGTLDRAIRGNSGSGAGSGFTIRNIVFDGFAPTTLGAVTVATTGSLVDYCEVRNTAGTSPIGVWSAGAATVQNSYIHHNGKYGFGGNGDGLRIFNNEISFNNAAHAFNGASDAGGAKWAAGVTNALIQGNYAHHNGGAGLWVDSDGYLVTFDSNRVEFNDFCGIDYEISQNGVISNNLLVANGVYYLDPAHQAGSTGSVFYGSDININTCRNVEVFGNQVTTSANAIGCLAVARGNSTRAVGPFPVGTTYVLTGLNVHGNAITVTPPGYRVGGVVGLAAATSDPTNHFHTNTYSTRDLTSPWWVWGSNVNQVGWLAAGQDADGSFLVV